MYFCFLPTFIFQDNCFNLEYHISIWFHLILSGFQCFDSLFLVSSFIIKEFPSLCLILFDINQGLPQSKSPFLNGHSTCFKVIIIIILFCKNERGPLILFTSFELLLLTPQGDITAPRFYFAMQKTCFLFIFSYDFWNSPIQSANQICSVFFIVWIKQVI